jgi:hypothetical protein
LVKVRGIQVALVLGLTGCLLVWFFGLRGEPGPGGVWERAFSRPANPTAVPSKTVRGDEVAGLSPRAKLVQPGMEPKKAGETRSAAVREGAGWSSRAPAQIVNLIKRKNLEVVIEKYARAYGVDEDLVWAVIRQESGFNPHAVSPKGAMGLMQLMPGTAALMGVRDAFDVEQNIAGGIKYLERCLNRFNQNVGLALAAYNAGPENVVKYQGCPPFPETRQYVASILQTYAGETMRGDLQLIGEGAIPDYARPRGLPWRIPLPQWRIAEPNCKLGPPHWKMTLRPF